MNWIEFINHLFFKKTTYSLFICFFILNLFVRGQINDTTLNEVIPPGIKIISLSTTDDIANSIVITKDGKLILSGYSNSMFTLFKLLENGEPDSTFGSGGMIKSSLRGGEDLFSTLFLEPTDEILISGNSYNGKENSFALMKFFPGGTPDTAFGDLGQVFLGASGKNYVARSMAVKKDGKILVAGSSSGGSDDAFAIARFNPSGIADPGFGTDGSIVADIREGNDLISDVLILPDNMIIVAGSSCSDFIVAKYLENGITDRSFGNQGITVTSINQSESIVSAICLQPDGKLVVAGSFLDGDNFDFAVVRYNSDGQLDRTFGNAGIAVTSLSSGDDKVFDIALQKDGKIVVGGSAYNGRSDDFAVVRFLPDGSPDHSFSDDGIVIVSAQKGQERLYSLVIQEDDKIVAAGNTNNGVDNDFIVLRFMPDGRLDPDFNKPPE